jgi:hypothetical protein
VLDVRQARRILAGAETRVPEPIVVKGDGPFFEFKTKDTTFE